MHSRRFDTMPPPRSLFLPGILMCAGMLASGQLYIAIPIADAIASNFGIPTHLTAWIGTAFGFAYAVGFLIWGPVSDRFGRQIVLLLGLSLTAIATVGVAFAPSFKVEIAGRVVQGLCAASIPPAGLALISESLPVRWRPVGIALMSFSFIVAAPVAQLYARETGLTFPALMMFGAFSYALCAVGLASAGFRRSDHGEHPPHPVRSSLSALAHNPVILTAWAVSLTVLFSFAAFQSALHGVLDMDGWNEAVVRGLTVFGMLASFVAGFIIQRFGGVHTARVGLLLAAIALAVACASPSLLGFSIVALSVGIAITLPSIIAVVSQHATHASRGMAIAVYSFAVFLGASVAPVFARAVPPNAVNMLLPPACLMLLAMASLSMPWMRRRRSHVHDTLMRRADQDSAPSAKQAEVEEA